MRGDKRLVPDVDDLRFFPGGPQASRSAASPSTRLTGVGVGVGVGVGGSGGGGVGGGGGERPRSASSLSPVDLLASPRLEATLEQLVNSFVQEDKARLAARSAGTFFLSVNK